jgi:predicted  nucleic acid-binding Zn-ribbon protein
MPHTCVKCSKLIQVGSKELLEGCKNCGSHFFFYIKDEQLAKIKEKKLVDIPEKQKDHLEKDIREMAGIIDDEMPVILDLESVRITSPGKFEIDLSKVFNRKRPVVYKLEEGKYIIDLASTLQDSVKDLEIKNPNKRNGKKK